MRYRVPLVGLALSAMAAAQTGALAGRVVEAASGAGIAGARVTLSELRSIPDGLMAVEITDSSGRFAFSEVPAGVWTAMAEKGGYLPSGAPDGRGAYAEVIRLSEGERRAGIVLGMERYGSVSGTVRDELGNPVSDAEVSLMRAWPERGRPSWRVASKATTDVDGRFVFRRAWPGRFRVLARAPVVLPPPNPDVSLTAAPRPAARLAQRFYPQATSADRGAAIAVVEGREVGGLDFQLPFERMVRVRAKIERPSGVMAATLAYLEATDGTFEVTTIPDISSGLIGVEVPARVYILRAGTQSGKRYLAKPATVDLTSAPGDVDLAVTLHPPVDVVGRIRVEGPEAAKQTRFSLEMTGVDPYTAFRPKAEAVRDEKGELRFVLNDVPMGVWDLAVKPIPKGGHVKSVMLGRSEMPADKVAIAHDTKEPLEIVVSTQSAEIRGVVSDDAEAGRRPRIVIVAPAKPLEHMSSLYRMMATNENGEFSFRGLRAGSYRVYAAEVTGPTDWNDPEALGRLRGEDAAATEGGAVVVNPPLNKR